MPRGARDDRDRLSCLLEDCLTQIEKNVIELGRVGPVKELRLGFKELMGEKLVQAVKGRPAAGSSPI